MLTIVMYHYVRETKGARYPAIRGLTPARFRGQLDYLMKHYRIVGFRDLLAGLVPPNGCILTFDDGLVDHYRHVFPLLRQRGLSGAFFPPAKAILEHHVLDVHKIHFVLAAAGDPSRIKGALLAELAALQGEAGVPAIAELEEQFGQGNRLNSGDEKFVKYVLQKGLPRHLRNAICSRLFARFVTGDEAAFADELYMTLPQLQDMHREGMEIGGHGYSHEWLGTLPHDEQALDIARMVVFLSSVFGEPPRRWPMTYPCGSYTSFTVDLLRQYGCAFGCTSVPALASLDDPMALHRLDTIDLPFADDAQRAGSRLVEAR